MVDYSIVNMPIEDNIVNICHYLQNSQSWNVHDPDLDL